MIMQQIAFTLCFVFLFLLFVTFIILSIIYRPQGVLSFYELQEEEQDTYLALVNKIDTKLLDKFLRGLPMKIGIMLITGGVSLWFSGFRWLLKVGEKENAITDTKKYIETRRKRYRRKMTNWDTFPGVHIVMGGKRRGNNNPKTQCPVCKKDTFQQFLADSKREILSCSNCGKNIVIKRSESTGRPENFLIPGFYTLAIPLSGNLSDALDSIDDPVVVLETLGNLLDFIV
jgi:hypothetical protein